ncbi:pentapeptide repeat-containing protein, partial [Mycobacterium tuberculosis]
NANLSGAGLMAANLEAANLRGANMELVNTRGARYRLTTLPSGVVTPDRRLGRN